MKIIGTNQGQRGDLIMGTVVARAIKTKFPNSHFTLGINKLFSDMKDLFLYHPFIDDIHIWDAYDNWPNNIDRNFLFLNKFDIILHPMPNHPNNHCWFNLVNHQTEASCIMNGFTPPQNLSCYLNKYFNLYPEYKNYICIAPFTAWDKKNISINKWKDIVNFIKSLNLKVIQIGSDNETLIDGCEKICNISYFESTKIMLSCKMLICLDGGMSWVASAYNHPVIGLYGKHYDNLISSNLYEPINTNAIYLNSNIAENIDNELIFNTIKQKVNE